MTRRTNDEPPPGLAQLFAATREKFPEATGLCFVLIERANTTHWFAGQSWVWEQLPAYLRHLASQIEQDLERELEDQKRRR